MSTREVLMKEVWNAQRKITDLMDMVSDGLPNRRRRYILDRVDELQELIHLNQERICLIDSAKRGVDYDEGL